MNIQSVSSTASDLLVTSVAQKTASQESQETAKTSALSQDTVSIGESDLSSEYVTYTKTGTIAGSEEDTAATSETDTDSTELTDDEKWESILSKYNVKSMNIDDYGNMLCDMEKVGLVSHKEADAAFFNAVSKYSEDITVEDIKDGVLGNLGISVEDCHVNFSDLLDSLQNDDSEYSGDPQKLANDKAFLNEFYSKMKAYAEE